MSEEEKGRVPLCEQIMNLSIQGDRPIENEGFMSMRCQAARQHLGPRLMQEAKLGTADFIPLLPLYDFDFDRVPLIGNPRLIDVKHLAFSDLLFEINSQEGLTCFIDSPEIQIEQQDSDVNNLEEVFWLPNYGMAGLDTQYFDQIDATVRQRQSLEEIYWVLYVLLPGGKVPKKCSMFKRIVKEIVLLVREIDWYELDKQCTNLLPCITAVMSAVALFATLSIPLRMMNAYMDEHADELFNNGDTEAPAIIDRSEDTNKGSQ